MGTNSERKPGTLYLVGTPIGNLEDVTLRALRVLREVEIIAAEDTRVTRRLMQRYEIGTPLLSYHEHSGPGRLRELLALLQGGKNVALVSDAGMPGISDPGARLVEACAQADIPMAVIPGATAAPAALALSGFTAQQYLFLGFLPNRPAARRETLQRAATQAGPIVCFEAPHRLLQSLTDIRAVVGDRQAVVARELTKRFEEAVRGTVSDLIAHFSARAPRGEITIVIAGAPVGQVRDLPSPDALREVEDLISAGLSPSRAVAHVAKRTGLPRRALYQAYLTRVGQTSSLPVGRASSPPKERRRR